MLCSCLKRANRYSIIKQIGEGGHAKTYLAWDNKKKTNVAIKSLFKKEKKLWITEKKILSENSHPLLLYSLDTYYKKNIMNFVTPYYKGPDLFDFYRDNYNNLNYSEIKKIIYKMALPLQVLHKNRIAHLDIKLENYIFEEEDINSNLILIDFGAAHYINTLIYNPLKFHNVGTNKYIAPEIKNNYFSEYSDTWSIGVMIFILLTNREPSSINNIFDYNTEINYLKGINTPKFFIDILSDIFIEDPTKRISIEKLLNIIKADMDKNKKFI